MPSNNMAHDRPVLDAHVAAEPLSWLPCDVDSYLRIFASLDVDDPSPRSRAPAILSLLLGDLPSVVDRRFRTIVRIHLREMAIELGLGFAVIVLGLPTTIGWHHAWLLIVPLLLALVLFAVATMRWIRKCLRTVNSAIVAMEAPNAAQDSMTSVRSAFVQYQNLALRLPLLGIKLHAVYAVVTFVLLAAAGIVTAWWWPPLVATIGLINCATSITRFSSEDIRCILSFALKGPRPRGDDLSVRLELLDQELACGWFENTCDRFSRQFPEADITIDTMRIRVHQIRLVVLMAMTAIFLTGSWPTVSCWMAVSLVLLGCLAYGCLRWWHPALRPARSRSSRTEDRHESSSDCDHQDDRAGRPLLPSDFGMPRRTLGTLSPVVRMRMN